MASMEQMGRTVKWRRAGMRSLLMSSGSGPSAQPFCVRSFGCAWAAAALSTSSGVGVGPWKARTSPVPTYSAKSGRSQHTTSSCTVASSSGRGSCRARACRATPKQTRCAVSRSRPEVNSSTLPPSAKRRAITARARSPVERHRNGRRAQAVGKAAASSSAKASLGSMPSSLKCEITARLSSHTRGFWRPLAPASSVRRFSSVVFPQPEGPTMAATRAVAQSLAAFPPRHGSRVSVCPSKSYSKASATSWQAWSFSTSTAKV
mmetsp:Transcript_8931/g.24766  ORF Transcript_8931/g.24766 Transcript_8931/m.24766 type:complete len:262 (-) Transcript_8931:1146-1931(-)